MPALIDGPPGGRHARSLGAARRPLAWSEAQCAERPATTLAPQAPTEGPLPGEELGVGPQPPGASAPAAAAATGGPEAGEERHDEPQRPVAEPAGTHRPPPERTHLPQGLIWL